MRCIAVVGTRCVDADVAELRRWYADHVHQLMGFEALLGARLAQRQGCGQEPAHDTAQGAAPEWLCLYEFADRAAFEAYEASPVKAAAAADRERSWGHRGIEIVSRAPYRRLYRRTAGHTPAVAVGECTVALHESGDARTLAAAAGDALELLEGDDGTHLLLCEGAPARQPPAVPGAVRWHARYGWQLTWAR